MKVRFFKSVSFLMAVLVFSLPFVTLAQDATEIGGEIAAARAAAERDAVADISGTSQTLWFLFGALLGPLPTLLAVLERPSPDAMRMAGKSANYIAAYTDFYQKKVRNRKVTASGAGCLVGALAYVLLASQAE